MPCPVLRANAHHVSLRAAAGGEAIPFSAAEGGCFGGHAAAQQHHGVALESGKSPQGDFVSSRCSFNCRRGDHHVSLRAAAGGEAIPFSAAGDCFGGYAASQ